MARISGRSIEELKERVNILDVVSHYVTLKRVGSSYRGLSPFSSEKTPSFYVLPEKNIFKCFSSGHAGDVFRFVQLKENMSFSESVEAVALRSNFQLEYESGTSGGESHRQEMTVKKQLYLIHEYAADFYHGCFLDSKKGEWIRRYWEADRGFAVEVAKTHKIGFAPAEGGLMEALRRHNFTFEALKESGLFFLRDGARDMRAAKERFRGRLMIPIRDIQGRVIGFAGRKLEITPQDDPAHEAKYINSPETPIFHKSSVLFGLDHARQHVKDGQSFLMVEGQLDAIRCWSEGFHRAIAPQGTSVTDGQLVLLRRYSAELTVVLDADEAGQKAALRVIPMAMKAGLDVNFVRLPDGGDPDSILKSAGKEAFAAMLENKESAMHFLLTAKGLRDLSGQAKAKAMEEVFDVILGSESVLAQEEYLGEVSREGKMAQEALRDDFNKFKRKRKRYQVVGEKQEIIVEKRGNNKLTPVEYQLMLLLLHDEDMANVLAQMLNPEWITEETLEARLLVRVLEEMREGVWSGVSGINALLETDEEYNYIYGVLGDDVPFEDSLRVANQCVKRIFTQHIQKEMKAIDEQMNEAGGDWDTLRELQARKIELRKALNDVPQLEGVQS